MDEYDDSEVTRTLTTWPRGRLPAWRSAFVNHSALAASGFVITQGILQAYHPFFLSTVVGT